MLYGDGIFRNPGSVNIVLDNQTLTNSKANDQLVSDYSDKIPNTKWVKDKLDAQNKATVSQDCILRKEDFNKFNFFFFFEKPVFRKIIIYELYINYNLI